MVTANIFTRDYIFAQEPAGYVNDVLAGQQFEREVSCAHVVFSYS